MTQEQVINKYKSQFSELGITVNPDGSLSGDTGAANAASVVSAFNKEFANATTQTNTATNNTAVPASNFTISNKYNYKIWNYVLQPWTNDSNTNLFKDVEIASNSGSLTKTLEALNNLPKFDVTGLNKDEINKINLNNTLWANEQLKNAVVNSGENYIPSSIQAVIIPDEVIADMVKFGSKKETIKLKNDTYETNDYPDINEQIQAYKTDVFNNGVPYKFVTTETATYAISTTDYYKEYYFWANEKSKNDPAFKLDAESYKTNRKEFETSEAITKLQTKQVDETFQNNANNLGVLNKAYGITDITKLTYNNQNNEVTVTYDGKILDLAKDTGGLTAFDGRTVAELLIEVAGQAEKGAGSFLDTYKGLISEEGLNTLGVELTAEQTKALNQYKQDIKSWAYNNNLNWDDAMIETEAAKAMGENYIYDVNNTKTWMANNYSMLESTGITGKYSQWSEKLKEGYTVRDLAGSYISELADLFGVDPNAVGLNDRLLAPAIIAGKDGQVGMSLVEYTQWLKRQPEYERTEKGQTEMASFSSLLRNVAGA